MLEDAIEGESPYAFGYNRAALGPIWTEISRGDSLSRTIHRALSYAERQVRREDLLMKVEAEYPEAYERLEPSEEGDPAAGCEQAAEGEAAE